MPVYVSMYVNNCWTHSITYIWSNPTGHHSNLVIGKLLIFGDFHTSIYTLHIKNKI